jgi:hypothetical protein
MSRTRLLAGALSASLFVVSGCGGTATKTQSAQSVGSASPKTTTSGGAVAPAPPPIHTSPKTSRLTRAQLIAAADAICARLSKRTRSVTNTSLAGVGSTAPLVAGYYRAAFAELRNLTPPRSMARDWKAIVSDIRPVADETLIMGKYATDNDPSAAAKVEGRIARIQLHRIAIAKRNGFKDCAEI